MFGVTLAFKSRETAKWHLSERRFYQDDALLRLLINSTAKYSYSLITDLYLVEVGVTIVFPTFLMVYLFSKFFMPASNAKEISEKKEVVLGFNEIGGNESAKQVLLQIAGFLKNPESCNKLGIRIPKGVLLYGPPGTGKTLLAKAFASECGIPFIYYSGSEFVELYVGLGPKKVRELFNKAREHQRCIIFIDEIDSLGGERGVGSSWKEFDNTLNQLLTEMDGFNGSENIIVIGATNQEDKIDDALLRPGRFDRKICIEVRLTSILN